MMAYTFRTVVESIRKGQTDRFATDITAEPGELLLLVSGRPHGVFDYVEDQPDDNPIRAVVEISKVEEGPSPPKYFVRWGRLVFGEATPTYRAEVAFDREGHPRYGRLVAISKRLDETGRSLSVVDLDDGEVLNTDFDRLTDAVQAEGDSASASDA